MNKGIKGYDRQVVRLENTCEAIAPIHEPSWTIFLCSGNYPSN
jgi:hypothetical protein